MEVVVLGMHRSGTSLVASLCQTLGVHMGERLLGTHPSQPFGHFEDMDFYELNMDILKTAGGSWDNPPSRERILGVKPRFDSRIQLLMRKKSNRPLWGWKDPRTCLTLPLYRPYLLDPVFLLVLRHPTSVANSLVIRSGGTVEKWSRLVKVYLDDLDVSLAGEDSIYRIMFSNLVSRFFWKQSVENLMELLRVPYYMREERLKEAQEIIRFRV